MIVLGANGSFPSSRDEATKLTNIIPLNNPHTRTTGLLGTRISMADIHGRKAAHDYQLVYCEKTVGYVTDDFSNLCPYSLD